MPQGSTDSPSTRIVVGEPDGASAHLGSTQEPPDVQSEQYREAYSGLAGEFVQAILPFSEASPMALLIHLLAGVGNLLGSDCYANVGTKHPPRLYVLVVGRTATGRKGTAWAVVHSLLTLVSPDWAGLAGGGLSSAEGLLSSLQRDRDSESPFRRKRLIVEPEFGQILKQSERPGNTLSELLRKLWDSGSASSLTRLDPLVVTDAHLSIVGHVTPTDLAGLLGKQEIRNGFINRFLFTYVARSKTLKLRESRIPPGLLDRWAALFQRALQTAELVGEVEFTEAAASVYDDWRIGSDLHLDRMSEHHAALVARGPAHVVRLALIYALLDLCSTIDATHVRSAIAVWNYSMNSARYVVPEKGVPQGRVAVSLTTHSERLLARLHEVGRTGLTFTQQTKLFGNNVNAAQLGAIRSSLEATGRIATRSSRGAHGPATQISYLAEHAPPIAEGVVSELTEVAR